MWFILNYMCFLRSVDWALPRHCEARHIGPKVHIGTGWIGTGCIGTGCIGAGCIGAGRIVAGHIQTRYIRTGCLETEYIRTGRIETEYIWTGHCHFFAQNCLISLSSVSQRQYYQLSTPSVLAEARRHSACPQLTGVPMEDYNNSFDSFEMRVVGQSELLTVRSFLSSYKLVRILLYIYGTIVSLLHRGMALHFAVLWHAHTK